VGIFHHSLQFLQSESFQTYVGTIHRRAIGPLAHHNGTSAYIPSLTCTSPVDRMSSSSTVQTRVDLSQFPDTQARLSRTVSKPTLTHVSAVSIVLLPFHCCVTSASLLRLFHCCARRGNALFTLLHRPVTLLWNPNMSQYVYSGAKIAITFQHAVIVLHISSRFFLWPLRPPSLLDTWVLGVHFRGVKRGRDLMLTTLPLLVKNK
jgi:hypothetical protein